MKLFKFVLATGAIAMLAQAGDFRLRLFQQSVIAGTELAPGYYKVQVEGDKVKVYSKEQSVQASAAVETNGETYRNNSVRYSIGDGKYRVAEIQLGGTNKKLVFGD